MPYVAQKKLFHNGRFVYAGDFMEEPIKRSILQLGWAKWDDSAIAPIEKKESVKKIIDVNVSEVALPESPIVVQEIEIIEPVAPVVVPEPIIEAAPEPTKEATIEEVIEYLDPKPVRTRGRPRRDRK